MLQIFILLFGVCLSQADPLKNKDLFNIHVVHINDFHARFEETDNWGRKCSKDNCIGGFSRQYEQISRLRDQDPNLILLNAGDNFQGTFWYTVFKWNVTQYFMKKLKFDAITLGNHEFDDGIKGVTPFMKSINAPVVVSNIDDSLEPDFQGLYTKSTIIERNGKKIGIIGVITSSTSAISESENLKFLEESSSVNTEAEKLMAEEDVFTIIVLSHCGYDADKIIAKNATKKIALIVGGHSHSFLFTGEPSPGPDEVVGPYPTIASRNDGNKVLITQAAAFCKYIGNISILYNSKGEIESWEGSPIFLNTTSPKNENIDKDLQPWQEEIDQVGNKVLGNSLVHLDGYNCYQKECTMGNMITDAFVYNYISKAEKGSWTYASIAIINSGGVRSSLNKGNITYNDILTANPFGNTVDVSEIQGKYIRQLLERVAAPKLKSRRLNADMRLTQVSGIHYKVDLNRPVGSRIQDLKVRCRKCDVPKYEDLNENKMYRIITPSFLTQGGDNLDMLPKNLKSTIIGPLDVDVIIKYLTDKSPVYEEEGRISVIGGE
ncbi:unnamed protein product [Brassicogethes aeneus]|uniref:apyrase n=1 Tax=Brassicogethes aeneus TaxID=1431903 RepID=A0A9P0FLA5_BRAAE|nr:unnamed protein product [Brassicogethes aeneus]